MIITIIIITIVIIIIIIKALLHYLRHLKLIKGLTASFEGEGNTPWANLL